MNAPRGSVLLADDEEKILKRLGRALREQGHEVVEASSAREAQRHLAERTFDLFVVDNVMPGISGLELLREVFATIPDTERPQIVMMTAHGSTQIVREAFKLGIEDFLEKPFEVDELLVLARRAVRSRRLQTEKQYLISERDADFNHYGIVGRSRAMQEVIRRAGLVAETKSTVLITGETGTGKEMVARMIHHRSAQREMPLIKVNCAAIPDTLLESELFGHVRGAFTGASTDKTGLFEAANGGTLLLDEIGELPTRLQAKLLRVLQEGEVRRVGDQKNKKVDVRVLAATARDLEAETRTGRFREDLFYRINVVAIELPPLRERRQDIAPLARLFAARLAKRFARLLALSDAAVAWLEQQEWPGNVRELENAIERAAVLSNKESLDPEDFSQAARPTSHAPLGTLDEAVAAAERQVITAALAATNGNRREAAKRLGVSLRTLFYKIDRYGID